ncbi:Transcription factor TFIIIB component B, partial [Cladochytrium tenue]
LLISRTGTLAPPSAPVLSDAAAALAPERSPVRATPASGSRVGTPVPLATPTEAPDGPTIMRPGRRGGRDARRVVTIDDADADVFDEGLRRISLRDLIRLQSKRLIPLPSDHPDADPPPKRRRREGSVTSSKQASPPPVPPPPRQRQRSASPVRTPAAPALAIRGVQPLVLVNGELQLDESRLMLDPEPRESDQPMEVIDESASRMRITSASFRRNKYTPARWTADATNRFYQAVQYFGSDFTLIALMFPTFTRKHIKMKFCYEERVNSARVSFALLNREPLPPEVSDEINQNLTASMEGRSAGRGTNGPPDDDGTSATATGAPDAPGASSSLTATADSDAPAAPIDGTVAASAAEPARPPSPPPLPEHERLSHIAVNLGSRLRLASGRRPPTTAATASAATAAAGGRASSFRPSLSRGSAAASSGPSAPPTPADPAAVAVDAVPPDSATPAPSAAETSLMAPGLSIRSALAGGGGGGVGSGGLGGARPRFKPRLPPARPPGQGGAVGSQTAQAARQQQATAATAAAAESSAT